MIYLCNMVFESINRSALLKASRGRILGILLFVFFCVFENASMYAGNDETKSDPGQISFYKDYSVIRTNCETWEEAYKVVENIVARGGIISTILSPQYLLGWVPQELKSQIEQVDRVVQIATTPSMQKQSVSGPYADDVNLGLEHFRLAKTGLLQQSSPDERKMPALSPCGDVTQQRVFDQFMLHVESMIDSTERVNGKADPQERQALKDKFQSLIPIPPGDMNGIQNVDVFMMESTGGSSVYNWTVVEENRVVRDFIRAFDFWSAHAVRYGRSVTFRGSWYRSSTSTAMRVSMEPVRVTKANDWRLVKQVMENLGYTEPWGNPILGGIGAFFTGGLCVPCDLAVAFGLYPDGSDREFIRVMKWNDKRAEDLHVRQSYCAFVKFQPETSPDMVFRAYCQVVNSGMTGGSYTIPVINVRLTANIGTWIMVDTKDNRFPAVVAHETGHIYGAPDEYQENPGDADCPWPGFFYRGAANLNCEATNTNSVTAMMRNNSMDNLNNTQTSTTTPIHIGWISAPARTIRFRTEPAGIPMTLPIGITGGETFTTQKDLLLGLGYRIEHANVPPSYTLGGTTYYFDGWFENGTRTLYGVDRVITIGNSINEYSARYTSTGGGISVANSTLEARLGVVQHIATPRRQQQPGIVLVWRSTLTETDAGYEVEYYDGSNWQTAGGQYVVVASAGRYCYANVTGMSGPLAANTTYRLRVVPWRLSIRGTPSNEVTITTRPSLPINGTYAYDPNEDNETTASATPVTSSAASGEVNIDAALTYLPTFEFGFSLETDVYRVTVSDLVLDLARITVIPKPGSQFIPRISVQPVGGGTPRESSRDAFGNYTVAITANGSYYVTVTAQRTGFDIVNADDGMGSWGEYTMRIQHEFQPFINGVRCPACIAIRRESPGHGSIYPTVSESRFNRIFTPGGMQPSDPFEIEFDAEPAPGFVFRNWEGDVQGTKSPISLTIDPSMDPPDEKLIMAKFDPLPNGTFELVVDMPRAYRSILGDVQRYKGQSGAEFGVSLPEAALSGFEFEGWDGNVTSNDIISPPQGWLKSPTIRVRLTRNLWLHPVLNPKPCVGTQLQPFVINMVVNNQKNEPLVLQFGMQPGASDSLEAGQAELPPVPVSGIFDYRFMNIAGAAQGSLTDIRGMKPSWTYTGNVQPGDNGDPLTFSWDPIPPTLPGSFLLAVGGGPYINMRSVTSHMAVVGKSASFKIVVTPDTCRELPKGSITTDVTDVHTDNFPYFRGHLCVTDEDGNPIVNLRAADVMIREQIPPGPPSATRPAYLLSFHHTSFDCYEFEGVLNDDAPHNDANKKRGLIFHVSSPDPAGQGDVVKEFDIPVPDPGKDTANGNGKPNTAYLYQFGSGWQLVSLPLMVSDGRLNVIFQGGLAGNELFAFDPNTGYMPKNEMMFGAGYWVKLRNAGQSTLNGLERSLFDVSGLPGVGQSAANGWNLFGALSYDVNRSSIAENPPGSILSLFEFDNGYKPATILKPGHGYWIKLQPNASLHLVRSFTGGNGGATKSGSASTPYEDLLSQLPHVRDWNVTDNARGSKNLFTIPAATDARLSSGDRTILELPPLPPSNGFDARFESQAEFTTESDEIIIRLQGTFPILLSTGAQANQSGEYIVSTENGSILGTIDMKRGGSVVIPSQDETQKSLRVLIRKHADAEVNLPSDVSLSQNYPNPFSPGGSLMLGSLTIIPYSLKEQSQVEITLRDVLGPKIKTLLNHTQGAGRYSVTWDGRDEYGSYVPAGTYIYELRTDNVRIFRQLMIVK